MSKYRFIYPFLLLFTLIAVGSLHAQERVSRTNHEIGFWVGASNPVPGTRVDEVLDANVGGGLFYRVNWPWVFLTELGASWTQYFSRTEQQLTVAPIHLALAYRLPFDWKIQTLLKLGGGGAWLEVRPDNRSGWEPLLYSGIEFHIPASRRFRVGLRLDYNLIYERNLDPPPETQLWPLLPGAEDLREQQATYEIENGHFFHFGLMVSFIL